MEDRSAPPLAPPSAKASESSVTMSTVEIAELTGKQHDNVLADARKMLADLKKDVLSFQAIFFDSYGRPQPCLNLPKLECLTLVSGYSVELRHRINARWIELKAQAGELVQTFTRC